MKNIIYILLAFNLISCNKDKQSRSIDITNKDQRNRGITKTSYYNEVGTLEKTLEYINLCGKKYLNQGWYFNDKGDTILNKGNFFKVKIEKNVLKLKEQTTITISYNPLNKNTISGFLLSKENMIEDNYCNLDERNVDTLYFVDNKLQFSTGFKEKGRKNLGGYILEVSKELTDKGIYSERKVYLSIPIEVK